MTPATDRGPDQGDADRHRQLHRLPGVPGGLQAVERAATARRPSWRTNWASRTRRRSARRRHAHRVPRDGEPGRSREAWNPPSSCSGASTAWSRPASPRARRRRSTGRPTVRCRTTSTTASAADTACWRVPGTCRPRNGTHAPRRSRSARTAPTAPLSRRRSRSTGSRCPTRRPGSSPTPWRFQPASRRARPTPCATAPGRRCWRSRTSASPTGPTGTSTTSTERRSWAGRACCTCRPCRSRNSAFRRTARSPFRPSPRRRSAPCLPP